MTDESKPSLLDTVSAAIEEVSTPASAADESNTTPDPVDAADTGEGSGAGDSSDGAGAGDGDGAGDSGDSASGVAGDTIDENDPAAVEAAEKAGRKRGADGKFLALTDEEKAAAVAAAAAQTPEQKAAAAAAAKKPADPINDPIPTGLKKETQQRMTKLVEVAKTVTAERDTVMRDRDFLMERIEKSTATPEQYNEVLDVVQLINSTDVADRRKALDYMHRSTMALAKQLGVSIAPVDAVAEYADLKSEVELGHISRVRAEEIANARNAAKFQTERVTQAKTVEQEAREKATDLAAGKQSLNALEEQLKADPNYQAKRAILTQTLPAAFKNLHPSKWAQAFQEAYNRLNVPAAAPAARPVATTNQPLRARQPAGGQAKAPSSMLEAINAGIASAR